MHLFPCLLLSACAYSLSLVLSAYVLCLRRSYTKPLRISLPFPCRSTAALCEVAAELHVTG